MAYSGIGGQAVMEGVMMKNQDNYAVAVRKADKEIVVEKKEYKGICPNKTIKNIPFVRGVINFIDSLVLGMSTLTFSASFFEEEEEKKPKSEKKEKAEMGITVAVSVVLAVVIFMMLPFFVVHRLKEALIYYKYVP